MAPRIPVTLLGATGVVGQRFVARLARHPQFELRHLCASPRNAGVPYGEACTWRVPDAGAAVAHAGLAAHALALPDPESAASPVVFSALDAGPARELEPSFARAGCTVFSNASAFRMSEDVPLIIPEVNPDQLEMIPAQQSARAWSGAILCNPNCTTTVLAMTLAPLHAAFGVEAVHATSMQALSGAGHPGVSGLDALGNVLPYIPDEEEKLERETRKLLGRFSSKGLELANLCVSAHCYRVPVIDGHTLSVSVRLNGAPAADVVREVFEAWRPSTCELELASSPPVPLRVHSQADRPQVALDVQRDRGMSVHVGRIRECPVLGVKFTCLGHNTERGAAGGSLLLAELALARGILER